MSDRTSPATVDAYEQMGSQRLIEQRRAFEAHLQELRAELASTNAEMAAQLHKVERAHRNGPLFAEIRRYSGEGVHALFDLIEELKTEVEGVMRTIPGFVSYSLIRTEDSGATFTVCNDKAGADQSARIAHDWIARNAGDLGTRDPEITEGRVIVHMG